MSTINPKAFEGQIPAKPLPFSTEDYFRSLAKHAEGNGPLSRALTAHLGSTAAGKLVERSFSPEIATRLNAMTALKLAHAVRSYKITHDRLSKEKVYKKTWAEFQNNILIFADQTPGFGVVQIGAYDGLTNDRLNPLLMAHPEWEAVLVEPMPDSFAALTQNYRARPQTTLVNAAVVPENGPVTMHRVVPDKHTPLFIDQTCSIYPEHLDKFREKDSDIQSTEVRGYSLSGLFDSANIGASNVGLLFIDAEGCDYDILQQLLNNPETPQFLVAEHDHMSDEEYREAYSSLQQYGYRVDVIAHDFLAQKNT